jgi:WD40 repeat protein
VRLGAHALRVGGVLERAISWPLQMTVDNNHHFGPERVTLALLLVMAPSRGPEPLPRALHISLENHKGPVHVARYAKGSAKYVLTGGQDRLIRLWNPHLGTEIKAYSAHGYEVLSISV